MKFSLNQKDVKKMTFEWIKSRFKPLFIILLIVFLLSIYFIVVYCITKDKEAMGYMIDVITIFVILLVVLIVFGLATIKATKTVFLEKSEDGSMNYSFDLIDGEYSLKVENTGSVQVFKKSDIKGIRYTKNYIFLSLITGVRLTLVNCEEIKNMLD